ncbi:carboxylating nicotinate-nucleotide diphosphorylase [Bacillus carboniphilus]|uniref:nicotinate-nucleotide diphosphorylase (carboxylating) n=1 Tax=Bacillus carboniphilus TaxID=86663 RepID=A0ABY9K071_9BACI|nr:carboxylating nicotinate-nucleotide diphosphorylase [Bacillus carboniphilus]WLR44070.1 carboxylating nicotinate-nucleotide diphosphorylase [Bacillus carboniphilus]
MNKVLMKKYLRNFFIEDIGEGDVTSESIFPFKDKSKAFMIAKENGVFSGRQVIREGYTIIDSSVEVNQLINDGEAVSKGDVIAEITGSSQSILQGERVILNLIQRMSGIATLTNKAVATTNSDHTRICDTRKTTPGLRMFEKYAVTCGGGFNHRLGLYDGVMIKDNHIAFCGSIEESVKLVRSKLGHMVKVEVEIESEPQLIEAIKSGADIIMFDNRTPEEVERFVEMTPKSITTEASGGITFENLREYGQTGVDYISLGMLTHSAKSLDISLNVNK